MKQLAFGLLVLTLGSTMAHAEVVRTSTVRALAEVPAASGRKPAALILSSERTRVTKDYFGSTWSETWRLESTPICAAADARSDVWRTSREWIGRLLTVGDVTGFLHVPSSGDEAYVVLSWSEGTDAGPRSFCADIYRVPLASTESSPPPTPTPAARLRRLSARSFTLKLRDALFGETGVSVLADIYGGMREYRYDWRADAWFEARGTDEPVAAEDLKAPLDPPTRPPSK